MPVSPDDPRLQKCGFAKLLGDGVEYYMRKYEVILGRRSKSASLDVVLGDNMNISREHAKITYNFNTRNFELTVMGKNGVTVGKTLHTPSSPPAILQSQDFVSVGDRSFYFLLPKDISKVAIKRKRAPAGLAPPKAQAAGVLKPAKPAAAKPRAQKAAFAQKLAPAAGYAPAPMGSAPALAPARTQLGYSAPYQEYANDEMADAYDGEEEEPAEADEEMQYEQAEEGEEGDQVEQDDEQEYAEGEQEYAEGEQEYAEPYEGEDEEQGQEQADGDGYDEEDEQPDDGQGQTAYAGQRAYPGTAGTYYAGNGAYH